VTSDLSELYQEVILDHNRRPRHFHALEHANRQADGYNPLCGDKLRIFLKIENDVVREASFQGSGCAISKASASMMTDAVVGRTLAEVDALFSGFHRMVTAQPDAPADAQGMGKLAVFAGVREFPARVKCATLAWHTLQAALRGSGAAATTEGA
jgi:nitrogen fixation protein NifU and related proteins